MKRTAKPENRKAALMVNRCACLAWLCAMLLCVPACRTIRPGRHTRALTAARALSLRGADQLQQENYEEAAPLFNEALKHSDADERAHWGLAEVLWNQGDHGAATQHMSRAAKLSGYNPELLIRLGQMHLSEGQLDQALENAEQVLVRDRQAADAWALKGQVLRQRNEFVDALDCYQRALICRPVNPDARVAIAEIYHLLDRPQRALATLDQLADDQLPTEQMPARAWMLKGQSFASLGQPARAKDCLRLAAICAEEHDSQLLLDLAQLQYASGDLAEARICLGRALRHNPDNPNALAFQHTLDRTFDDYGQRNRSIPAQTARWQSNSYSPRQP